MAFPATFLDLQSAVIDKARLDTTDDTPRVKDWINSVYYTACIETDFYESSSASATLTASSTSVAVPATIVKVDYIVPTGSGGSGVWGPMAQVTLEEILELRAYSGGAVSTGAPSRFAFRSSQAPTIEFWPQAVGGEVLTFYGESLPAALVNPGETPIIPEPYTKVIEYGALIHACEFKKDLLLIQQVQQEYQDWLSRLRGFNNTKVGAKVQQFRVEGRRPMPLRNDVDSGW